MTGAALASIGVNIASDLIGRLLMQIKDTSIAAHKVLFAKRSFREFKPYKQNRAHSIRAVAEKHSWVFKFSESSAGRPANTAEQCLQAYKHIYFRELDVFVSQVQDSAR